MKLERQQILVIVSVFMVALGAGFLAASITADTGPEQFEQFVNHTAGPDENVLEINFDNRSLNLLYEDSPEAKMYLDLDQDGSFDRKLNTTNDGEKRLTEEVVTLKDKSYRLYFRYMDDANITDDGYLELYRIRQIQ